MQEFDAGIGEVRHRLTVPPLTYPDYLRLQRVLFSPHRRGSFWKAALLWIVIGAAIGALLAVLGDFELSLFFIHVESGWSLYLFNFEVFLAFLLAFLAGFVVLWMVSLWQVSRMRRRFYARLLGEGRPWLLAFGTEGLGAENAGATSGTPWRSVIRMVTSGTMRFLVINDSSALWIPEAMLTAQPEIEHLLQARIAGNRPTA